MEERIEKIEIDKRVIGFMEKNPQKFIEYYYSIRSQFKFDSEAYEHVESIIVSNIGIRRYKNFKTFKVIKNSADR